MSSHEQAPVVAQEPDTVHERRAGLILGITLLVTAASAMIAALILSASSEGLRSDPGGRAPPPMIEETAAAAGDPSSYGWVDRAAGQARIPIERAIEIIAGSDSLLRPQDTQPADTATSSESARTGPADTSSRGQGADTARAPLAAATLEDRNGSTLPLRARLTDDAGETFPLGAAFDGVRPVVLVLGYYHCTMLCGLLLDGIADAVRSSGQRPGEDFRLLAVSIDPRDDTASARRRRATLAPDFTRRTWPFLIGRREDVAHIADAVGFGYAYDERSGQYAHPAVTFVLTPDGRLSRQLRGLRPGGEALAAALDDARAGRTGTSIGEALLRCFHYLPALRRWAGLVNGSLRWGALVILLGTVSVVALAHRRDRTRGDES